VEKVTIRLRHKKKAEKRREGAVRDKKVTWLQHLGKRKKKRRKEGVDGLNHPQKRGGKGKKGVQSRKKGSFLLGPNRNMGRPQGGVETLISKNAKVWRGGAE